MTHRSNHPNPVCPICHRELLQGAATQTYPFCGARCKLVDLGKWLGDGYVIAGPSLDQVEGLDLGELADLLREPS
jgi:uncharacterized protein